MHNQTDFLQIGFCRFKFKEKKQESVSWCLRYIYNHKINLRFAGPVIVSKTYGVRFLQGPWAISSFLFFLPIAQSADCFRYTFSFLDRTKMITCRHSQNTLFPVGSFVSSLEATDSDSGPNGHIRYNITRGNTNQRFYIDQASGRISIQSMIDRDPPHNERYFELSVISQYLMIFPSPI